MQTSGPCQISDWARNNGEPPPTAIWYDESHQHFLALSSRRSDAPYSVISDMVEYQIISLEKSSSSSWTLRRCTGDDLLTFRLPSSLALENHPPPDSSSEIDEPASSLLQQRLPVNAKLSLDRQLLALQVSPTLLRIIPVTDDKSSQHHWTLDLSSGNNDPMISPNHTVPVPRRKIQEPNKSFVDRRILENGVIWSDHGGNSQDLVIITNKAVLCYKVSLRRSQMAATHSFNHPAASAVWWDSPSRTVVVGSYGPSEECQNVILNDDISSSLKNGTVVLQLRTFRLRFSVKEKSKKRVPRLELPPPVRLPPFGLLGLSNNIRPSNTSSSDQQHTRLVTKDEVHLGNIYGKPLVVQLEVNTDGLSIHFHRLDPTLGGVLVNKYKIDSVHPTREDVESWIVGTLDNVFCVHLRDSLKSIFLDLADIQSSYFLDDLDETVAKVSSSSHLRFVLPSLLLDESDHSRFLPVELDIEKLDKTLPMSPSIPRFFLVRSSPNAHKIAVSKFEATLQPGSTNRERRQGIDMIIGMYVANNQALTWDWKDTFILTFRCALLPCGAEFRYHDDYEKKPSIRPWTRSDSLKPSPSILYQKEIVESVLLPKAREMLSNEYAESNLAFILAAGIEILGALDEKNCPAFPGLECFIFGLLWRMGYEQEMIAFLESRVATWQREKLSKARISQFSINAGTNNLVNMMLAISQEVAFGCNAGSAEARSGRLAAKMQKFVQKQCIELLASRVVDVHLLIQHILAQGRVQEAMNIYATNLIQPVNREVGMIRPRTSVKNSDNGIMEVRSFLCAGLALARTKDPSDRCRLLYCLHHFISRVEPGYRESGKVDLVRVRQRRRMSSGNGSRSLLAPNVRNIHRRPSSQSLNAMTKRSNEFEGQHLPTALVEVDIYHLFRGMDAESISRFCDISCIAATKLVDVT